MFIGRIPIKKLLTFIGIMVGLLMFAILIALATPYKGRILTAKSRLLNFQSEDIRINQQPILAKSAMKGGDMGFVHEGMLAEPAQKALDKLTAGQVSDAVMSLQGIAIFRLDEKQTSTLNGFEDVKERARKLLQRENSDIAWDTLLKKLRANAKITINSGILAINNE